jgi:hypothetical protein
LSTTERTGFRMLSRNLLVPIIPLLLVFTMIVVMKVIEVL